MVVKLYGDPISMCTQRVAVVLHEKKVPFEIIPIHLSKGEHKSPEFLKLQPFGQVPVLDDDGFIVYESRAIAFHIANKWKDQGTPLIPTDLRENTIFHQAASVEVSHFDAYADPAFHEKVINDLLGRPVDLARLNSLLSKLETAMDIYDQILSKQKYVAGNEITLIDFFHLPYSAVIHMTGSKVMETRPNVKRWFDDIASRPSWLAVKDGVNSTV